MLSTYPVALFPSRVYVCVYDARAAWIAVCIVVPLPIIAPCAAPANWNAPPSRDNIPQNAVIKAPRELRYVYI